jgi:Fe-S cluster assembly ATPase SufC
MSYSDPLFWVFSAVLITHYQRILRYTELDRVHVMPDGQIVTSGGNFLARSSPLSPTDIAEG